MDYGNGISKINEETISKKFNIPERTLRDAVQRLEKQSLFSIIRKKYENKNPNIDCKSILKNYYHFDLNPKNYFFVYNDFFKLDLSKDVKGFLLALKAICLNNSNTYTSIKPIKGYINKSELSRLLSMNIKTIELYLNKAEELGEITIIDNHIIVKNNCFPIRVNEQKNRLGNRETEIVNTILKICNQYNAIMPLVSEEILNRILLYYPLLEDSIRKVNDDSFTKANSLEYALNERIKSLPTQINAEYILKALNIPKLDKKEITQYEFILS